MQTQIITEAGTVIGIYDPKDEHEHLTRDSEVSKMDPTDKAKWENVVRNKVTEYDKKIKAATTKPAAKKTLKQLAVDALPKSTTGKAAMVGVPAAAALAMSPAGRKKYSESRDVRHYRPASAYYDDGFGKAAMPKWFKTPAGTVRGDIGARAKTLPKYVKDKLKSPAPGSPVATVKEGLGAGLSDPTTVMTGLGLAATGASAAAGAVKARRAAKAAAKAKAVRDAKRAQNVRDAAIVGSVAAPVALGTHLLTRRNVEKSDDVEKGVADALKNTGKKLRKAGQKAADPTWQQNTSKRIADLSGDAARTATNVRSVVNDAKKALIPKSMQKPQGMSMGQKAAIGGAGVGGLLIGRELSGPKPYPYQQQR